MGRPLEPIDPRELEELYVKEHRTVKELSVFFSCGVTTIKRHLARNGIRIRSQSEEMSGRTLSPEHREKVIKTLTIGKYREENPNWKGGKSTKGRSKDGLYTIILIDGKYVPEHRYVMEQYHGRKLRRNEEVHHENGIKTDNRIGNLRLYGKSLHAQIHMTDEHRLHLSNKMKEARATSNWSTKKKPLQD